MADEFPAGTVFSPAATNPSPRSIDSSTIFIDSTISSASNWNQTFLGSNDGQRVDTTLMVDSMMATKFNYKHQEITSGSEEQQNPSIFKSSDDHESLFLMEQPYNNNQTPQNFYNDIVTTTSQGLPMGFPFGAISIGFTTPMLLPSSILDQPKQFLVNNHTINNCCSLTNSDELSCRGPMFQTHLLQPPPLNFSNGIRPKCSTKLMDCDEVVQDSSRVERENENKEIAIIKRPRSDNMPSPSIPTFKVRKEKLGDKITSLQQLVSPYGKTDTASVLHEAIEYIKFLHEQIRVLSTPYMEIGDQDQEPKIKIKEELKEKKKEDLISRGLCVVTIPSTIALANGNILDFWSPTFGGTFR